MSSKSEHTFGNKLKHARDLQVAVDDIPGYAPDNKNLAPAAFDLFLDTVEAGNDLVASVNQTLSDERAARRLGFYGEAKQGVDGLSGLAGRVRDNVGSMIGGKKLSSYRQLQKICQKIRNYHPPRKPVSGTPNANKKEISRSEASYGSLLKAGRDLAAAVAQVPGYNPAAADLQPAALKAAMKALDNLNKAVAKALMASNNAIEARALLYEDEKTGLRAQFQQVKAAVGSQFGRRSAQYKTVSHIRY